MRLQQIRWRLVGRGQQTHGKRKIVSCSLLADVSRCQVDGDAFPTREVEAVIAQRGIHTLLAFFHRAVRQANEEEERTIFHVHLGGNNGGIDTEDGTAKDLYEHVLSLYGCSARRGRARSRSM